MTERKLTDEEKILSLLKVSDDVYANAKLTPEEAKTLLDLINRLQAENERLEYILLGVMHSVDKWLDGEELDQDEVNRAITMREKTLQIVERLKGEVAKEFICFVGNPHKVEHCPYLEELPKVKAEAIKEFAEWLKEVGKQDGAYDYVSLWDIDDLVKAYILANDY